LHCTTLSQNAPCSTDLVFPAMSPVSARAKGHRLDAFARVAFDCRSPLNVLARSGARNRCNQSLEAWSCTRPQRRREFKRFVQVDFAYRDCGDAGLECCTVRKYFDEYQAGEHVTSPAYAFVGRRRHVLLSARGFQTWTECADLRLYQFVPNIDCINP
jgi:hypothetical protein